MQEFKEDKPDWLRIRPPSSDKYQIIKQALAERGLNTVCASAKCPNTFECWDNGALTFMILGNVCTRACRFCAVAHNRAGESVDPSEPEKIADMAKALGLQYVVITSVDRDDLDDHGAGHYAACIRAIKNKVPGAKVEAIIPDFSGRADLLLKVMNAGPDVIAHNMETVERLTSTRPRPKSRILQVAGCAPQREALRSLDHDKIIDPARARGRGRRGKTNHLSPTRGSRGYAGDGAVFTAKYALFACFKLCGP